MFWTLEPNAAGVNLPNPAYAPQPNCRFNADANTGHAFGIFMASVGTLRLRLRRRLTLALGITKWATASHGSQYAAPRLTKR